MSRERDELVSDKEILKTMSAPFLEFIKECAGGSFRNGLYRTHTIETSRHWAMIIGKYFTAYAGRIMPFGYDCMGRQFCVQNDRPDVIYLFDPTIIEDFALDRDLVDFHNIDLVEGIEEILEGDIFEDAKRYLKMDRLKYRDCLGYKVPLFLKGRDAVTNREISNMEVYWEFQCQLYNQVKDLPPGTKINSIKFEPMK